MIIGSGPIVIGQACEFDYSGTQACKALKEEGYRVVLVNSNPATIMTDPESADVTYIEPLTPEVLEKIIARERPDALLPTLGGQTGLNLSLRLSKLGILKKYGVELIGAKEEAIEKGEDREKFRKAMLKIGLDIPQSAVVHDTKEAADWIENGANFRSSYARATRSAERAEELPTTARNTRIWCLLALARPPSPRCSSRSACSVGRNLKWRSCATTRTSAW